VSCVLITETGNGDLARVYSLVSMDDIILSR
jgi:hypothetical protein